MRFQTGLIVAGVVVVLVNGLMLYLALGVDDPLEPSYQQEAR